MDDTTDQRHGGPVTGTTASGPWRVTDAELLPGIQTRIAASRRMLTEALTWIAELSARGLPGELGYRDTASLLGDALVLTRFEATQLVNQATALTELPVVAAVAADGQVGAGQITAIADTINHLPGWATTDDQTVVEKTLADLAPTNNTSSLRRWGRDLLERLDQDGRQPPEPEPMVEPHNELHVKVKPSGRVAFAGELDPEPGSLLTTLLSAVTTPQPVDGEPDSRTTAQRAGDGLAEILHHAANTATLPEDGGQKPHITVTVSLETLQSGIGTATLATATPAGATKISAAEARRIACDCEVVPMVLGSRSEPLDVGRTTRTVPTAMRKAVITRDHSHCVFPNCDRPAQWSDIHHIEHWLDNGETKLDNLAVLCRQHHTLIHHSDWHMTIDHGVPTLTPPAYIDPQQEPRTNRLPGPAG